MKKIYQMQDRVTGLPRPNVGYRINLSQAGSDKQFFLLSFAHDTNDFLTFYIIHTGWVGANTDLTFTVRNKASRGLVTGFDNIERLI